MPAAERQFRPLIDGKWASGDVTEAAMSPSSGRHFADVVLGDANTVDEAVTSAKGALPDWSRASPFERAAVLRDAAGAVTARREELARLLTEDQGKPLGEAFDEVDELAVYLIMAGEDAKRLEGSMPPSVSAGRRVLESRLALGVIGVITPWNWPFTMGAEIFAPALAAGNTVVWVPAPTTSACSGLLAELLSQTSLPPGVFNFVPGKGPVVGDALAGHKDVAGIGFIGSVATGQVVSARAAGKAQLLELGGNGPMVVLDDADLALAAEASLEAAYLCAGQSCTAGERFLVHEAVAKEFVERVVALTEEGIRLGDPFDPATTMGPLNNEPTAAKFDRHLADALSRGARCCAGGRRSTAFPTNLYAEATVLDQVGPEMEIALEETFGPVVPVMTVSSAQHALDLTNSSPFGLTAAVFTEDLEKGLAFAEAARTGWVNINASTNLWESHLAFGGRAGSISGRGRVGGRNVLEAFSEQKTILLPAPRLKGR